jgi:hypothetical protein
MSWRRLRDVRVASINGSTASSAPLHVAGQAVAVDTSVPAALGLVEGSNDLQNWTTATSRVDGTTALSTLADATHFEVFERFKYIRLSVTTDAGGPRNFDFGVSTYEEE